ncbi:hypothetical protein CTAYLR_000702 [Chrysophaeum taylorii]|uniref:Sulfotransferase n=1 Tax=Chrysophaeum taylorii TaxID=2483200 RepID=A0AAD7UAG0_9STRA|nr:hypothetical protein CTAYLR_000702 [Chrysophaeum taylorii]
MALSMFRWVVVAPALVCLGVNLTEDALLQNLVVIPEHKVLFCRIDKNAGTAFSQLWRSVRGEVGELYYGSSPGAQGLGRAEVEALFEDPSWHKAVFFREPLERFASGFASKCLPGHDKDTVHCKMAFGSETVSPSEAVRAILEGDRTHGILRAIDKHFAHQHRFCGGLLETLEYYDTVEQIFPETIREKVLELFEKVGIDFPHAEIFDAIFPEPNVARAGRHVTNARASEEAFFKTIEPALVAGILRHYAPDHFLFGIKVPPWAIRHYENFLNFPRDDSDSDGDSDIY